MRYEDIDEVAVEEEESDWDVADVFSKWTFSVAYKMLKLGLQKPLQFEDLMKLPRHDYSNKLIPDLEQCYQNSPKHSALGIPRLLRALYLCHKDIFYLTAAYTVLEGALRIACPVVLGLFLEALQDSNSDRSESFIWALAISVLNLLQAAIHHILFFYTMRMGYNFRTSAVGMIFDTLFKLPGGALNSSEIDTGVLVNLISNDVARFDEATIFFHMLWEPILEVIAIQILLSLSLNFYSGLAGVCMTVVFIPVQLRVAREFSGKRRQVASLTDKRVRYMSESIQGIASVKSFGWEKPFFSLLTAVRMSEMQTIGKALDLKAINYALYFCSPHVASFATFIVYINTGGTLTLPIIYTTLSLLQILRLVIGRMWTRAIETFSECTASCQRIENFLNTAARVAEEVRTRKMGYISEKSSGGMDGLPVTVTELSSQSCGTTSLEPEIANQRRTVLQLPEPCSFYYPKASTPTLSGIKFSVSLGEVVMVVGPVGSGKSSLLSSILGDLEAYLSGTDASGPVHTSSVVQFPRLQESTRIAYCAQRPWIIASSVRANVSLAGRKICNIGDGEAENFKRPTFIDSDLYNDAIEKCRLVDDLKLWPAADDTEIGERGVSVSGGQKARISLARAVYSDADLYLLDDPLSAVDANVGKDLFFDCIVDYLKVQKHKAVVLVTHQVQHMQHADKILVLDKNGQQVFFGAYNELEARISEGEFSFITSTCTAGNDEDRCVVPAEGAQSPVERRRRVRSASVDSAVSSDAESLFGTMNICASEGECEIEFDEDNASAVATTVDDPKHAIIQEEDRVLGKVTYHTYVAYLRSGGLTAGIFAFVYAIFGQLLSMSADYWLRWWAGGTFGDNQQSGLYVGGFAVLVLGTVIVGYHKAVVWLQYSLHASSNLHTRCLWAVLHSPIQFFIANPTGRILNRFAKDQNQVDEMFPSTFFDFVQCTLFCLSALVLVCVSMPWLILLMPPLWYIFIHYRSTYITSSREVKRIEALTRSPIYADFSAALEGLHTLRAYDLQARITSSFRQQLDANHRVWNAYLMISRWIGFRLDFLCTVILIAMAFMCAFLKGSVDVGLVGFALVYTLTLAGLAQWTVRQSAEVENQMTAVERIDAYAYLRPEDGYSSTLAAYLDSHDGSHPEMTGRSEEVVGNPLVVNGSSNYETVSGSLMTPMQKRSDGVLKTDIGGNLEIRNLTVTYREDLPPVLRSLSINIWGGCKAGICGRTGSGKSSLLLALLRLNIITSGDIYLDGESILDMSLEDARSNIAIIPQDPHLFSGTVRFNLDPFNVYTDLQLWAALSDAHIKEHIESNQLGLSAMVEEGGKNFSVGQRQLLSLARAIVRRSRVVLMDEVTASIDYATDQLIQSTIRSSSALRYATIVTVAHRLRTIADSDIIVVINAGECVEKGSPSELLKRPDSCFRKLAEESNEFSDIMSIALSANEGK